MKIAVFPGSFDPITLGHLDIIERSSKLFDKLIVLIAINPDKKYHFTLDARIKLLEKCVKKFKNVVVDSFSGHTVAYCKKAKANTIVRGIRDKKDLAYELKLESLYKEENPKIEVVYLSSNEKYKEISSTKVNELIRKNKEFSELVPECVNSGYKKISK